MSLIFTDQLDKPSGITATPSSLIRPIFGATYGFDVPVGGGEAAFANQYSVSLDGTDDTLDVASTSDFAFGTSGFSIGFWFKPEGTNNSSGFGVNIFDMRGGVVNIAKPSLWMSSVGAGSIFKYYAIGYKPPSGATATINPGTWYHLLITNDGSNTRLYLDGNTTPISTGSDTNNYLAAPLRIGGYSGNDYYYNGLIDEFAIWDATLSGDDANAIYNDGVPNDLDSAASYDTDRTSNLIGWWRMGDGGTWDGSNWTIPDASTNSNTGTTANMAEASRVTTVPEYVFNQYSLSLDGSDDYINVPHDTSLSLSSAGTFSVWVKMDTSHSIDYPYLFAKWAGSDENYTFFTKVTGESAGKFRMRYWDGSSVQSSATEINRGEWVHLAATLDGSNLIYYVNGSADNTVSMGMGTTNTGDLRIGYSPSNIRSFPGLIDEAAIFSTKLSSAQISNIYKGEESGGSGGTNGVPGSLATFNPVGWWRMGDGTEAGSGTTVYDMSSNSNNGTLTNGPTFSSDVPLVLPSITNTLSGSFDGSDDYLLMGTSAISLDTNFTISAWFKPNSAALAGYDFMCGWGNNASGQARVMQILNSKLSFEIYIARVSGATTLSADTWYHGAVTFSGDNVEIFLNGSSDGTGTISRNSMSSSLTFAGGTPAMTSSGFAPFSGLIDEFAVFDSVLSSTAISAIYNSGVPADISSLSPVGWWRLGDGTGDTDSSGGTPANTDAIGTVVNQGSASNANGTGTNGPTYSNSVPS